MKNSSKFALVALALAATAPSFAAAPAADKCPSRPEAEEYIKKAEARWAEQSVTNDMSVIKEIIADDYIGVNSASQVVDKDLLMKDKSEDFVSNKLDYAEVHFFSNELAVVQGLENWEKKGGVLGSYIWTDTWMCRKGRWQIIGSQDTSLRR